MVIESIVNPFKAEKRPWEMFFVGFVYSTVAVFLSIWIFEQYASLVMVFLTVLACAPFMYSTMKVEEMKDVQITSESRLLKEHGKALAYLVILFLGITASYTFWYSVLPADTSETVFSVQTETISNINSQLSGDFTQEIGFTSKIFLNNVKVLVFCVLFAFIYGLGAIFILVWNASVIATAVGNFIRVNMGEYVGAVGFSKLGAYLQVGSLGVLRYSLHGIPEILAYFVGGLAGGIISIAIIRHDFGTKKFEKVMLDSSDLLLLAIALLLAAAFIEVYITPVFF